MAGWSKVTESSELDCFKTLKTLPTDEFWIDLTTLDRRFHRIVNDKGSKKGIQESSTNQSGILMELEEEYLHLDLDLEKSELSFTEDALARRSVESDVGTENCDYRTSVDDERHDVNRKRKRESYYGLVDWVKNVAKDPCHTSNGKLPDRSKWKFYGAEHLWKQVLLAREWLFLKRSDDSSNAQSIWQKKQKMHPTMYEDHGGSERSRCSQRILSAKETKALLSSKKLQTRACSESSTSTSQSDVEDQSDKQADPLNFWIHNHSRKRIPVGPPFQAKVPEWTGETQESDSKWLGTQIWPLEKGERQNHLIERDRIGKGRQESCGCQFPASLECIRFHISEKRMKVKLELCSAFQRWEFDKMGEQVSQSWTEEEEKKFQAIVKSNPPSLEKCLWEEMFKSFPSKSKGNLLSYFYNVFLLQRRSHQNRYTPCNIDSDDEEPGFGWATDGFGQGEVNSTGSIFRSPRKVHLNFR
ncbi:hypothetical protein LguiA_010403 [Lonicera macranthoides]